MNIKGVKELFKNFLFEVKEEEKQKIEANLICMLKVKYNKESPRKPPQVIIQGPPGSGRSTQSKLLAEKFGLIHISTEELLANLSKKQPELGKIIT